MQWEVPMWGALVRIGARYAFFRRWKNTIVFVGGVLLCALTAFLIDAKMYLSGGFIGVFAAGVMLWLASHYLRERREIRERERRKLEEAIKRAAAAKARSEKIDNARTAAAGVVKGVSSSAAGFVNVAQTGFSGARDRLDAWRNKPERSGPK
jgi:hypothetical protein